MRMLSLGGLCLAAVLWAILGPAARVRSQDNGSATTDPSSGEKPADAEKDQEKEKSDKPEFDALTPLPDKQLKALHAKFVAEAQKLAKQYLKTKQPDRAVAVYREILKIVPDDPEARQQLENLRAKEAVADSKVFVVQANRDWQDTGVRVIAGKPLKLSATGKWTLNMSHEVGPDGIEEMPKAIREFRLGSLVGMIDDPDAKEPKLFVIGSEKEMKFDQSGPLLVRIHDTDPSDNQGSLRLEITGRFDTK
jgi:Tetratricopeptide repeat